MNSVYIIAEAGVNHNGDFNLAKKMILAAKQAGADAVKFQTFRSKQLVSFFAPKADYQKQTTEGSESQLEMLKKLELSYDNFAMLKDYASEVGVDFLSTPFDLESIGFLDKLGIPVWKIPSGEITNKPYLLKIARTGKPVIISTGMCTIDEIEAALRIFIDYKRENITLLHCNTEYPTPFIDVNLKAMETLGRTFGVRVGYSDHTTGIEVPIAATALGACIIEKHFTLDRDLPGPDHKASLVPFELNAMVKAIRNVEMALGSAQKKPSPSETKNIVVARKSIVANREISKGELFTEANLATKRPGDGISPMRWDEVLGNVAKRDFSRDEKIEL